MACRRRAAHSQRGCSHSRAAVRVAAAKGDGTSWNPPTVADTKRKFYEAFRKPVPGIYNNIIQELLVQQHLMRFNRNYNYDEVFGLGFTSVFEQVLEGLPEVEKEAIFTSYVNALGEDPAQYKKDAAKMEAWASGLGSPETLKPASDGDEVQQRLASIAARAASGEFLYTKFFAIGLFRLLELTGAKDPKALEALVRAIGAPPDSVNRDLMTYKGILSKLSAAKELLAELAVREKKKMAEREAEKKALAEADEKKKQTVDAAVPT
ncbi:hypothetical protein WJX81_008526 [Elliptochloris bilobata]|uniref:Uncharacterized protein n=1 Tax=Elliptochloris bilobata TaxID=381761 RepID=A0AAW1R584_9CHLO